MNEGAPLIYFHGISKGTYAAMSAAVVADDAATKTVALGEAMGPAVEGAGIG